MSDGLESLPEARASAEPTEGVEFSAEEKREIEEAGRTIFGKIKEIMEDVPEGEELVSINIDTEPLEEAPFRPTLMRNGESIQLWGLEKHTPGVTYSSPVTNLNVGMSLEDFEIYVRGMHRYNSHTGKIEMITDAFKKDQESKTKALAIIRDVKKSLEEGKTSVTIKRPVKTKG